MRLIVGLGNVGTKYVNNRHNVGFRAVERIHDKGTFAQWTKEKKFRAQIAKGKLGGGNVDVDVMLVKPETFMNDSGIALLEISRFFKIPSEDIIVIHDELDLAAGKVKTKVGGGAAGHNGLRSIDSRIGREYQRVRIGIQHPGEASRVESHVLSDFDEEDEKWVEPLIEGISQNIHSLIAGEEAMFIKSLTPDNNNKEKR